MDTLKRTLIEKTGNDYGFEYVISSDPGEVVLASARHPLRVGVALKNSVYIISLKNPTSTLVSELIRQYEIKDEEIIQCSGGDSLADLLKRISSLGQSLPNQAKNEYDVVVKKELEKLPDSIKGTEVERMVRQRVGQQTYRKALMEYWGGACAVTGVSVSDVLRASHAKPWAECKSDNERLNVFNGFLLSANLDALFDKFLISFTDNGEIIINLSITSEDLVRLGINSNMKLRWIMPEHLVYLEYHRNKFLQTCEYN